MMRARPITAIAVAGVLLTACSDDEPERVVSATDSGTAPETAATTGANVTDAPATPATATIDAPAPDPTAVEPAFPPPGLPLRPDSEVAIGAPNLVGLISGDDWLFAVDPPSVVMRIDPRSGEVARLDLALGASGEGPVRQAFVDGSLWAIGGPFRDTLVEVDPISMTEQRRIVLDDDHGIRQGGPVDELWLSTIRGVRPVDVDDGEVGDVVPLEVDPRDLAVGTGAVWVTLPAAAQVARIDTTDGRVDLIDTEPGPTGVAVHKGVVWVTHPPTASISRIDAETGEVLGVTDVDIGGDVASVTDIPGLAATEYGVLALVRLAGSPYEPIMIRIDPDTGRVRSARTVQVQGNTWEPAAEEIWFHRADNGSIVAVDLAEFDDVAATPLTELAVPTTSSTTSTTTSAATSPASVDEDAVADAFEQFTDVTVPSAELALGPLARVRDDLLDLLDAQVGGEARLTEVIIDDATATTRFDVVVEGDTVVLPAIEFVFERRPDGSTWTITETSLCTLATGVNIPCP